VSLIVARFFAGRRAGRRVSIDDVLRETTDASGRAELRAAALTEIARQARTVLLAPGSSERTAGAPLGGLGADKIPEIAGYDVIERIGQGGMGTVYEGYQQATGRRVAIKVMLDGGAGDEPARRRFEREVELAARLTHPGIVSVLDSGVHRGHYFYVMDYFDGAPLDRALTPGAGDPRGALEVLARAGEIVDYAHQRGVLHRDLKPGNILLNERGELRLLDFGLAKALRGDLSAGLELSLSRPGQLLGTVAYMPPEQSRGEFEQMSVRSDVYALGAIGYELLTGRLPVPTDRPLAEVLTAIETMDPVRPSALRRGLDRDIDALLLKALEKAPQRRYATAAEFAADIRRYLAHEPIAARRIGPAGRLMRWAQRNRAVAAVSAVSLVVLAAVTGVSIAQITAERDKAVARGEHAQRVMAAMQDMLAAGDPARTPGADVTLRQQFDAWENGLQEFASEPAMDAGLRGIFGRLALAHGEYERAERNLRRAVELHESQHDPDSDLADARLALAGALHKLNRYADAEAEYRAALALRERAFGPAAPETAESLSGLAWVVKDQDRYDEAEALYRRAVEILRAAPGDQRSALADVSNNFAQLLTRRARYNEAEPLFRSALALRRELFGDDHQHVATTLKNLGNMLRDAGDLRQAAERLEQAHEMLARLLGPEHPTTIVSMNELGLVLKDYGDFAAAEPLFRRALELRVQALGGERFDNVAVSKHNLAVALAGLQRYDEAEALLDEALRTWRETLPDAERSYKVAVGLHSLADLYRLTGRLDRAREVAEQALRIRQAIHTSGRHVELGASALLLGRIALDAGDAAAAESDFREALRQFDALPEGHWRRGLAESLLGRAFLTQGRPQDAEPLLTRGAERLRQGRHPRELETLAAVEACVTLYERLGDAEKAATYRNLLVMSETGPVP
jgi:tetratricopeptide (TPR) repeat protein